MSEAAVLDRAADPALCAYRADIVVDADAILAPLARRARGPGDRYLAACAAAGYRADAVAAAAYADDRATVTAARRAEAAAERAADVAAAALIAGRMLPPNGDRLPPAHIPTRCPPSLAMRLLGAPVPECCAYNIADVEICIDDATWLAGRCHARVLVVGIRGGGAMLAPLWAAALRTRGIDADWTTVRPIGDPSARVGYDTDSCARLVAMLASEPADLLLVDDLPDTGETVAQLATALVPYERAAWFAAVGQVARLGADGRRMPVRAVPALLPGRAPRLWQLLMPADRPAFLGRLAAHVGPLPADASLAIRMPALEARYGRRGAWRPWNDPALAGERRRLVNPGKTPLAIVDAAGTPLWHLRFEGEGPWGSDGDIDGYRVASHVAGLVPLRERLASAGADRSGLLAGAAALLADGIARATVCVGDLPAADIDDMLRRRLAELAARFGLSAPPTVPRLPAFAGRGGRLLFGGLRHAYGAWHWQVRPDGQVLRFEGGGYRDGASTPALEVASFAMEQALGAADTARVAQRCDVPLPAVVASLNAAMLVAIDAIGRGVRQVDALGRRRMAADVAARAAWVAARADDLRGRA